MNSKERAHLRALANGIDTVLQIGKEGIGENLIHQADMTLQARELIKGRVLDTCMDYTPRTAADALAQATDSEVVQVIGSKFVLYRKRPEEPAAHKPPLRERHKKNTRPTVERRDKKPFAASGKPYGKDTRPTVDKRYGKPSAVNTHATFEKRDEKSFGADTRTASGTRRGNTRPTLRKQGGGRPLTGRRFENAGKNRK